MNDKIGVLMDCDGTLMDTIGAWHEAEFALLEDSGKALTKEQRDELNTLTLEEAGDFFHDKLGIYDSGEEVVADILRRLLAFYRTKSEATPGAVEFTRGLFEAGVVVYVLSSSPQEFLQVGLQRGGFKPYLHDIVSVEDLGTTKREGETYLQLCERMGTDPARTWLFDDSWYAVATAREAGLRCVGVFSSDNCGTHEELARYCDVVVDSFEELDYRDFAAGGKMYGE